MKNFIIIGVIAIYITIIFLLYKAIIKANFKHKKIIVSSIFALITVLQIICTINFQSRPIWDFPVIQELAKDFNGEYLWGYEYIAQYPNNLFLFGIFKVMYKLANIIGFYDYDLIGTIFNMICIDLSALFTFLAIKKAFNSYNKGIFGLIIFTTISPIFVYTCIYYTDTLSMLFAPLMIYIFLFIKNENSIKKIIGYSVLLGAVTLIGMMLKMTVIIVLIAIFIRWIFSSNKAVYKIVSIAFIIAIMLCMFVCKGFVTQKLYERYNIKKEEQIPYTHWIMMGLNGNGGYNEEDFQYTKSFKTKEEKTSANISEIKNRVNNIIETKNLKFVVTKFLYTWGDGTYFCLNKVVYKFGDTKTALIHFQDSWKVKTYLSLVQIRHISMLLLILISYFVCIKRKDNNEEDVEIISKLIILGVVAFFMIWEARSRYLINFIPILIICEIYGIDNLINKFESRKIKLLNEGKRKK